MTRSLTSRVFDSIAFYPLSGTYLGGVGVLMLLAAGRVPLSTALLLFAVVVLLMLMFAMHREVRTVHVLVDRHVARITELVDVLEEAEIVVPKHAPATRRNRRSTDREGQS